MVALDVPTHRRRRSANIIHVLVGTLVLHDIFQKPQRWAGLRLAGHATQSHANGDLAQHYGPKRNFVMLFEETFRKKVSETF